MFSQEFQELDTMWPLLHLITGPDGAVAKSLDNGLVSTGFVSPYRLQHRADYGPMGR